MKCVSVNWLCFGPVAVVVTAMVGMEVFFRAIVVRDSGVGVNKNWFV
jgi:hypothetical protein